MNSVQGIQVQQFQLVHQAGVSGEQKMMLYICAMLCAKCCERYLQRCQQLLSWHVQRLPFSRCQDLSKTQQLHHPISFKPLQPKPITWNAALNVHFRQLVCILRIIILCTSNCTVRMPETFTCLDLEAFYIRVNILRGMLHSAMHPVTGWQRNGKGVGCTLVTVGALQSSSQGQ